jgi:hypothetical protein
VEAGRQICPLFSYLSQSNLFVALINVLSAGNPVSEFSLLVNEFLPDYFFSPAVVRKLTDKIVTVDNWKNLLIRLRSCSNDSTNSCFIPCYASVESMLAPD